MKIPTQPYRCPLARLQPKAVNTEAVKRDGWREQHILVVSVGDSRLDFADRAMIRRIGERLYGGRHD